MNFSEEWKSLWSISSVHSPPLLLSGPFAKPLGPLLFTPSPQTLTLLFSSPSLSSPILPSSLFSLHKALRNFTRPSKDPFILPSVISSITADFDSQSDETSSIVNNNLQILRCPNNDILLFFPTGENSDFVGFVKLSLKGSKPKIMVDNGDNVFTADHGLDCRILKILVISVTDSGLGFSSMSGNSSTVGFLLACTLYSVNWFRVEISNLGSDLEKPILVHLGTKKFNSSVVHTCWNPHVPEESVVLLDNGELFLFDLDACSGVEKLPMKLKGTKVGVSWEDLVSNSNSNSNLGGTSAEEKNGWLSCEFSWHPRIVIVAHSNAIFLIDWRFERSIVSTLANIEMLELIHSVRNARFVAFCKAGLDGFYFTVATRYHLLLLDIRKPLMPVLQWAHGLDNPHYITVFRLSELRPALEEDEYRWASESGFAIVLGSFWNREFSLFCYGPSSPESHGSVASKILNFCKSFYAWGLPSELSLSGFQCHCGDCLLRENFCRTNLPEWINWQQKEEMVLGFCIVSDDFLNPHSEVDCFGGFTLIRLVSSGKLELQKYHASWDFSNVKSKESGEQTSSQVEDSLLYCLNDQKYKFPKRFRYLRLDYLREYLTGELSKTMISRMQNLCLGPRKTMSYTQDRLELIREMLKVAGMDQIGSSPSIANVFNGITLPMSIYEIASSRMWAGLPLDLLQLAFSNYSELMEVLVDQKKLRLEFLDVPNLPQLPPFPLKKPSSRSNKWLHKVQPGDALVGPVLPLPVLLTLDEVNKDESCSISKDKINGVSADAILTHQCNKIKKVANEMVSTGSVSVLDGSHAVSLADDREEKWDDSKETKSLFFYKPCAFSDKNNATIGPTHGKPVFEDDKFDSFISKTHKQEFISNPMKEPVGLEVFDELCPIELNFDFPPMNFGSKELKGYKLLKRQFSKWQEDSQQYQDFLRKSKIQKRAP